MKKTKSKPVWVTLKRYTMWAAPENPAWLDWAWDRYLNGNCKKPFPEAIFPIVDNKTCGVIDGSPRPNQYFCICFDADSQSKVCEALNRAAHETSCP